MPDGGKRAPEARRGEPEGHGGQARDPGDAEPPRGPPRRDPEGVPGPHRGGHPGRRGVCVGFAPGRRASADRVTDTRSAPRPPCDSWSTRTSPTPRWVSCAVGAPTPPPPRGRRDAVPRRHLMRGGGDEEVLARARLENRVLVTADKDFGDLIFARRDSAPGVLLVRSRSAQPARKVDLAMRVVDGLGETLVGSFVVAGEAGSRVRRMG